MGILNVLGIGVWEVLLALVGKIAWRALGERFATRVVLYGLNKLKSTVGNAVVQETIDDITKQLEGKSLHVINKVS